MIVDYRINFNIFVCINTEIEMKTIQITDQSEIEQIIQACSYCVVSLVQEDGLPYSFPMNFAYQAGQIILHSGPEGSHLRHLATNNAVSVVFCVGNELVYQHKEVACSYRMRSKSVVCKGLVRFVHTDEQKVIELNKLMKHYTPNEFRYSDPAIRNVKVWIVDVNEITARAFGMPHQNCPK